MSWGEVACNNCEWEGEEEDLTLLMDSEKCLEKGCPNCKTDAYLTDLKDQA